MKTLIIIPAFNEAENLEQVTASLETDCPDADYIIINDGSTDNTEALCENRCWPVLNLPVNLGLSGAFRTGVRYGFEQGYDAVLQFDGDGQHDAKCARQLIEQMEKENADILIGSRFLEKEKPGSLRMLGSRMIGFAVRATTGKQLTDPTSGMRIYGKRILKILADNINYGPEPDTIAFLMRSGAAVREMQVDMHERMAGQSYLTAAKSMKYMANMFFSILMVQFFRKKDSL